ncbi:MAG: hypothetical protein K8T89_04080 [Planctomycetes bacterium]|nr:hypothetical protein [Planctomycetota bacterium]
MVLAICVFFVEGQKPVRAEDAPERAMRIMAFQLDERIDVPATDYPLPLLIEIVSDRTRYMIPLIPAKMTTYTKVCVNAEAFKTIHGKDFDVEKVWIEIETDLTNVHLSKVLVNACGQINAGYLLRDDRIEVLPLENIRKELNLKTISDGDLCHLVNRFFDGIPLEKALKILADRHDRKIEFSPLVKNQTEKFITARLVNTPIETALTTLAQKENLAVVRQGDAFLVTTAEHASKATEAAAASDQRLRYFASRLDARIERTFAFENDFHLQMLLALLGDMSQPIGRIPLIGFLEQTRTSIRLNQEAFSRVRKERFDSEKIEIVFTKDLKNVSLSAVLKEICQQINGGYVVRTDGIELLPLDEIRKEFNLKSATDDELRLLVMRFYNEIPLEKALNDLAKRHEKKIEISPLANKELQKPISARLINMTFNMAITRIADKANLAVVRAGDEFLVTTREDFAKLNVEKRIRHAETTEQRMRYLASRLNANLWGDFVPSEISLTILLSTLEDLSSIGGIPLIDWREQNRVRIHLNRKAFSRAYKVYFDGEKTAITFSEPLKSAQLSSVLEPVCKYLEGGYVIRGNAIELLPVEDIRLQFNLRSATDQELRRLVFRYYDDTLLEKALTDLAKKYERKIELSPLAKKEFEKTISAKLINITFDMAVTALAEEGGLAVVRQADTLLVTTKEDAAKLKAEKK